MTAIAPAHAGKPDIKHMDRWFAPTIRLRTEGTDHLLAAADAVGVPHVVAQSYGSWNGLREGGWVKTEDCPLDLYEGTAAHTGFLAIRHVEDVVVAAGGAALRYGGLYGPGASDDQVELIPQAAVPARRTRRGPLLVATPRGRGQRYRPGRRAAGEGCVQHRRRRARSGQRVAPLPGRVRRRQATDAGAGLARPAAGGQGRGDDDDARAGLL